MMRELRSASALNGSPSRGFTLIEVMIVVAIVGILAAIVFPMYQDSVRSARRTDGQGALMGLASAMERWHTENSTYIGTTVAAPGAPIPQVFDSEAPLDGSVKFYDLVVVAADRNTYTLRAVPKGLQAGDGFIELRSTGQKGWDADDSGALGAGEMSWR